MDGETAVSTEYKEGDNSFTGKIHKIVVSTGESKQTASDNKKIKEVEKQLALKND